MPKESRNPGLPALSPAEWEVMKVLWDAGPLAARDVFAALPPDADGAPAQGWAYRTVKTLLSRLVAKHAIDYEPIGNSYLYRTAVAQEELTRQEVDGVLERLLANTGSAGRRIVSSVLAQFLGDADLSDEEIRNLQDALERGRSAKKKRQRRGRS